MYYDLRVAMAGAMALCLTVGAHAATPLVHFDMEQSASPIVDTVAAFPASETDVATYGYGAAGPAGFGNAVSLDGNGSWQLSESDSAGLRNLSNDFSVAAWINVDSSIARGGTQPWLGNFVMADDYGWDGDGWAWSVMDSGQIVFTKNGIADNVTTGSYFSLDQWTHIAINVSSTTGISFYVNGAWVEDIGNTADVNASNSHGASNGLDDAWAIGRGSNSANNPFAGSLDEVRVYSDLLTPNEIGTLAGVPEPGSLILLSAGAFALLCSRRRR